MLRGRVEFERLLVGENRRSGFALRNVKVGQFLGEHGAVPGRRDLVEVVHQLGDRRLADQIQIHDAQVRPLDELAVLARQFLVQQRRRLAEGPVKRISDHGGLPRQHVLPGIGRFAKREPLQDQPRHEHAHVGRATQVRLIHATHRDGGALGQQRPDPIPGGRAVQLRFLCIALQLLL